MLTPGTWDLGSPLLTPLIPSHPDVVRGSPGNLPAERAQGESHIQLCAATTCLWDGSLMHGLFADSLILQSPLAVGLVLREKLRPKKRGRASVSKPGMHILPECLLKTKFFFFFKEPQTVDRADGYFCCQ